MPNNPLSSDALKDAVLATTRALSKKPELDINFSSISTSDDDITLPPPPKIKSDLASYRGKADSIACSKRLALCSKDFACCFAIFFLVKTDPKEYP